MTPHESDRCRTLRSAAIVAVTRKSFVPGIRRTAGVVMAAEHVTAMSDTAREKAPHTPKLAHFNIPALIAEALTMDDCCDRNKCVAPTVHLLAVLLRESEAERLALQDRAERAAEEMWNAHLALDGFDVPREETHFKQPYKLSGRIRWLRSTLVITGNKRAGAAEARVAALEEALQAIAEPVTVGDHSDFLDVQEIARAALAGVPVDEDQ